MKRNRFAACTPARCFALILVIQYCWLSCTMYSVGSGFLDACLLQAAERRALLAAQTPAAFLQGPAMPAYMGSHITPGSEIPTPPYASMPLQLPSTAVGQCPGPHRAGAAALVGGLLHVKEEDVVRAVTMVRGEYMVMKMAGLF